MNVAEPNEISRNRFSIAELVVAISIVSIFGCLSFTGVLHVRKSIARSLETSEVLEVGLIPDPVSVEEEGNDWVKAERDSGEPILVELLAMDEAPNPLIPVTHTYSGPPKPLREPTFNREPGAYQRSLYPFTLKIANPNDSSSTWTMVSVNGSSFKKLEKGSLQVNPGDTIQAYVRGDTREWNESGITSGHYIATPAGARSFRAPVQLIKFGPR